ncbi:NADH-quinone oxidoreductase subunit J [Magnetococcales bacterium HHB-1]
MGAEFVFYLFAPIIIISALMVVISKNTIYSVLFLVLTFFSSAGIFVILRAEFLAAILIMVYMGAVAILFLFVVMMLDIDHARLRQGAREHLPAGLAVGFVILVEMLVVALSHHGEAAKPMAETGSNTMAIGKILYTEFIYPFEVASLILLVAFVGAIVLTLRKSDKARKQDIGKQLARTRDEAVELKKVAPGEGA